MDKGYEIPQEILDLNTALCNEYDYGVVYNETRKILESFDYSDNYKTLSISDFEKYKIGICWDFCIYQAHWFREHGYKYETFYITEIGKLHSHAFIVFYLENSDKVWHFESSWWPYHGVYEYNMVDEILNVIRWRFNEKNPKNCKIYKTDFTDGKFINLSVKEFMNLAEQGELLYNRKWL